MVLPVCAPNATVHRSRPSAAAASSLLVWAALALGCACPEPEACDPSKLPAEQGEPLACTVEVAALLDRNDPWAARSIAARCSDPLARAETEWMLGNVDEAAAAFVAAREVDPDRAISVTELEAVMLADPARGADLVRKAIDAWYRGPRGRERAQLECIAKRLDGAASGTPAPTATCLRGPAAVNYYGQTRRQIHGLPAYALHRPVAYVRFQPIGKDDNTGGVGCGAAFGALDALVDANCSTSIGAVRALFAAVIGDADTLDRELAPIDGLVDLLQEAERAVDGDPDSITTAQAERERRDIAKLFEERRGAARFDTQRILAVAVAAAVIGQHHERARRYLPHAEAHARAILGEHLALVRGERQAPKPSHSPSDYSVVDMELFRDIDRIDVAELIARLANLRFSCPARLEELLATRPRQRAAVKQWVAARFVPTCRDCGIHSLLEATFRRREAARITGNRELEAQLREVTLKLGRALLREQTLGPIQSLESMLER